MNEEIIQITFGCSIVVSWNKVATLWNCHEGVVVLVLPVATVFDFHAFVVRIDSSFLGPEGGV